MNRQEWQRIEAAFDQVLDLPRHEWRAACARLAAGDATLQRELESLLENVDAQDAVLDSPAMDLFGGSSSSEATGLAPGTQIGAYRVIALLGRGGMGEVYRAERADGLFEHQVAIKLIRSDVGVRPSQFRAERQILARLEHPGIARLHDGGVMAGGRPFMIMELVDGQPITDWCRQHRASLAERLRLFIEVCTAVAYAHRNLVVHRDLKASNVLVTPDGRVKLLDFGIARLLDQTPNEETRVALTPRHAAPEQLTGGMTTTATDVYALGVLFFELLTDTSPWGAVDLPLALLVQRMLQDPVPLASEVAGRASAPPVAAKQLSGDLDAIVAKALRKEPDQRYESANALQQDIARMIRSEPVVAREGARLYVACRFLRRHRVGVLWAAAALLAVIVGASLALWQADRAFAQARRARAVQEFTLSIFKGTDPNEVRDHDPTLSELLDRGARQLDSTLGSQPLALAELHRDIGDIYGDISDFAKARVQLERALALYRSVGEEQSAGGIETLFLHGSILGELGEFQAAKGELERTIEWGRLRFGPRNRWAVGAREKLAYVLSALGQSAAAIKVGEEGLAQPVGEDLAYDRLRRLRLRLVLGSIQASAGQTSDSRRTLAGVVADAPSVPEFGFLDRATAQIQLARSSYLDEDYAAALAAIQGIIPELDRKVGATADRTIKAREVLVATLAALGRFDAACDVARANLDNRLARKMHEDEPLAVEEAILANTLRRAMRFDEAWPVITEALRIHDAADPQHTFETEYTRIIAGQILIGRGSLREGTALLEQAQHNAQGLKDWAGSGDQGRLLEALAWARRLSGDWAEAGSLFSQACAVIDQSARANSLPALRCAVELSWARAWLDSQDAIAVAAFTQSANRYRQALPSDHIAVDDLARMQSELDAHRGLANPQARANLLFLH
jgi:tetratricopeptide (TPR) repeat protein/predicted Ser/Thr protein kinase